MSGIRKMQRAANHKLWQREKPERFAFFPVFINAAP
jgi:hypothetical protein